MAVCISRTEKIHARIARLEREYFSLLREELLKETAGEWSPFLGGPTARRRQPDLIDCARYDRLARVGTEIESLRRKLGEPLPGSALAIVHSFRKAWDELGVKQDLGDWNALVKKALTQIEALATGDNKFFPLTPRVVRYVREKFRPRQ